MRHDDLDRMDHSTLRAANSPYAEFVHDGLEWQFQPTDEEALLRRLD